MRILGLSSFRHDTSAVILEDGVLKAAIENDKVTRTRLPGLPRDAIQYCFQSLGVNWDGIDIVAIATRPHRAWARKLFLRAKLAPVAPIASTYYASRELGTLATDLNNIRLLRRESNGSRVITFDHHLCHAASAFYLSPYECGLILTMDEDGDGNSTMVAVGKGGRIRIRSAASFPHSLAWVYSQITDLIGFLPHSQEHKTQWFGFESEPRFKDLFLQMLSGRNGSLPRLDYSFFTPGMAGKIAFSPKFYRWTGLSPESKQWTQEERQELAGSVQVACTEIVCYLAEGLCRREGIKEICLGGGLFQNVSLVASVEKKLGAKNLFVPPAPGNSGTSLGAAYLAWHQLLRNSRKYSVPDIYAGPKFRRQDIKDILDNSKSRYVTPNTEERRLDAALQLLRDGKIIGWFQGAAEFGPRALGNRNVLASPWAPFVKENLNDFIKHREWFRPFAIAVPEEECSQYFDASQQCRFMNSLASVRPDGESLLEGFLLPDRQVRLHVVGRNRNPLFWRLLKRFGEQARAPMLLSTSFNLLGEPLVLTPRDAIRSYYGSGLDALIIDEFLLSKSGVSHLPK
ncbi:MAG: hypothetical protein M3O09_10935 [Acidobacteriota bacterium]|nr:hypothetical protein [Acidobacteriota bacterium]